MAVLTLSGREVQSVFELLGAKENDLTYALGWALSRSPTFLSAVVGDVCGDDQQLDDPGISLQEYGGFGGGFTDVEIRDVDFHVVLEAKRGWVMPGEQQLVKYETRFGDDARRAFLLTVSDCSRSYAALHNPNSVGRASVVHRSWEDIAKLADCRPSSLHERRLLQELRRYLRGIVRMQDPRSNMVYVVPLKTEPTDWCDIAPSKLVEDMRRYFHPVGEGYPKEPPNYIAFRYHGKLQSIHHIDDWSIPDSIHGSVPVAKDQDRPHFLYHLGPPIAPAGEVRSGPIRNRRVYAMLDLLLTCRTIPEAVAETKRREAEAGR